MITKIFYKKKYLFLVATFIIIVAGSSYKVINYDEKLINSISSEKFKKFYALCRKKEDTICVYNNLDKFSTCPLIKIDCNKIVKIVKSKIQINVNSSSLIRENKIVLYKCEFINKEYKLFFINTETNGYLNFIFNRKNKLIRIESGVY